MSIFLIFTTEVGISVLNIDTSDLIQITELIPNPGTTNPIQFFFALIANIIAFTVQSFFIFLSINISSPEFLILNAVFIIPYTIVMVWNLAEFIRGIG